MWVVNRIRNAIKNISNNVAAYFSEDETDESPIGETLATTIENPTALLPHLNALRKHLFRAVLAIFITSGLAFLFVHQIMTFLAAPMPGGIDKLVAIDPTENVGTVMRVTLLSGFTIALPYIIFEIWLFIAPALRVRSRVKGTHRHPNRNLTFRRGNGFHFLYHASSSFTFPLQF